MAEEYQQITIFDDPESKIHFLEETLAGQDWRATVIYPDADAKSEANRREVKRALESRNIGVREGVDEHGHHVLHLHHFGTGSKFSELTQEIGLARGTAHLIRHPGMPFSKALGGFKLVGNWFNKSLHDPAQANGLINTTGEVFLSLAGTNAKHGKATDAKNLLQTFAGLSWLSQSLTYLVIAKNNEDTTLGHLKKKLEQTEKAGGDVTQITFDAAKDKAPSGAGHDIIRFLRRYPVQIGAVMNNLGMIFYLGHAVLERKYHKNVMKTDPLNADALAYEKGFTHDLFGALTSLVGWSILMLTPRKHKEGEEYSSNPFAKAYEKFRENPQVAAGFVTLGASAQRLMGANAKKNTMQQIGEKIYIGGDLALMFTNSHEYGGKDVNIEKLATKLAEVINDLPIVLGPKAQETFVQHSVQYLLDKGLADLAAHPDPKKPNPEELAARSELLKQALGRKVRHANEEHLEHVAELANKLVVHFPESERPAVMAQLSRTLSAMPWVHVTAGELETVLKETHDKMPAVPHTNAAKMKDLSRYVAELVNVIPGIDVGANAAAIHDALAPFIGKEGPAIHPQAEPVQNPAAAPAAQVHAAALQGQIEVATEIAR